MSKFPGSNRLRRASALVMILGVLAMLAVIISTFVTFARMGAHASVGRSYSIRTDLLANGVLTQVRMILGQDLESTQEPFDHPRFDPWLASILTTESGGGTIYRYISRMDLADTAWATGGPGGGRVPENVDIAANPTSGTFTDANRIGIPDYLAGAPNTWYYVDADGDGRADSALFPIGGGAAFPDGTCAYMAVRIVDNAQLNSTQHSKWPPFKSFRVEQWPNHINDITDGRVDWTQLPDAHKPGEFVQRPMLPHVSFENLRNIAMLTFGRSTSPVFQDNPDGGEDSGSAGPPDVSFSMGNGWSWNNLPDRLTLTDELYYPYEPGTKNFALSTAPLTGTGAWTVAPTDALSDKISAFNIPFGVEDDLALRTWNTTPGVNKYASVYKTAFGTANLGTTNFERNFARIVSSTTRERTKRWMDDGEARGLPGNRVLSTPFDLRKLLDGSTDYAANAAGPNLMQKLDKLHQWMSAPSYNVLGAQNGLDANGGRTILPNVRRAQFLANLCEYVRAPPTIAGNYVPTAYNFAAAGTIYGVCRQPFITEMIRDSGVAPAAVVTGPPKTGGLTLPITRDFSTVQVGIELHNPYNTPILLTNYSLVFTSVAGGGVTTVGPSVTVSLAGLTQIAPFGYSWIATDTTTQTNGTSVAGSTGKLLLAAADADLIRKTGPRLRVELRYTAPNLLMDVLDTSDRANAATTQTGPYTTNPPLNSGMPAVTGGGNGAGIDWGDWDGSTSADATQAADLRQLANAGWTTVAGPPTNVTWVTHRSGVYRPESQAVNPAVITGQNAAMYYPASAVTTNMWMGYAWIAHSANTLDAQPPFTGGTRNPIQYQICNCTPPVRGGNGAVNSYFSFGTDIKLPNRGVDPWSGTRFVNLGELAHVLTVGNTQSTCFTQQIAAASEYARVHVPNPVLNVPFEQPKNPTGQFFPGDMFTAVANPNGGNGYGINNPWVWVNFERQIKFDIYEMAQLNGPNGMPTCPNARMLDLVSLYLGNGGPAAAPTDFFPYTGPSDQIVGIGTPAANGATQDTNVDYLLTAAGGGNTSRPRYREGRMNMNTAPAMAIRCLPWPRGARDDLVATAPFYADGALYGNNVAIAECLAGNNSSGPGYLNPLPPPAPTPTPPDPYFKDISDVYLFAQMANPNLNRIGYNFSGMAWDAPIYARRGAAIYGLDGGVFGGPPNAAASGPNKTADYRRFPLLSAYQYPQDRSGTSWPFPSTGGLLEYPERGQAQDMQVRDSYWASTTNVCSTRSDVFTVYILIKLMRPSPLVAGRPFEELAETRMVAVVDRTNCVLFTDPANTATYGKVDLQNSLPRVLGRMVLETQ